jgi:hypothetical protein
LIDLQRIEELDAKTCSERKGQRTATPADAWRFDGIERTLEYDVLADATKEQRAAISEQQASQGSMPSTPCTTAFQCFAFRYGKSGRPWL